LPDTCLVRASALRLPYARASIGAVLCGNALQVLPQPRAVIAEVSRCLQPGGRLVLLTFRKADDPLKRYFQCRHEAAWKVTAFAEADLLRWLDAAGLEVIHVERPGTFLLITAER
jgi:ubiquinone/menaquinone biosynthesis C-methylase UbiE